MENYIRFEFPQFEGEAQEILLAELAEWPFEGFEEQKNSLIAFIPESAYNDKIKAFLEELQHTKNWQPIKAEIIQPQNWNASWEAQYEAVPVDDFCIIRAIFHEAVPGFEHEIVITPKMSFGTGHHATTYMMVQQMRIEDFTNKKVLDYGCGTSVLAILAIKLGAESCDAIDIDYWAYENSLENVKLNLTNHKINVFEGDWSVLNSEVKYDIILANINRHIILASMQNMVARLNRGGSLLCSGFLDADADMVIAAAKDAGLTLKKILDNEQWRCISFVKS